MIPLLDRIGIRKEVQFIFAEYLKIENDQIYFNYGNDFSVFENYSSNTHLIPSTNGFWTAGNKTQQSDNVIICSSAIEALAFLNFNLDRYPHPENLVFFSPGNRLVIDHYEYLSQNFKNFTLIFSNDIIGHITDLQISTYLSGNGFKPKLSHDKIIIEFKESIFSFQQDSFSLYTFYKATGFRNRRCTTFKPKNAISWQSLLQG